MIWFSPGWPLLSGPNIELTPQRGRAILQLDRVVYPTNLGKPTLPSTSIDPLGLADVGGFGFPTMRNS